MKLAGVWRERRGGTKIGRLFDEVDIWETRGWMGDRTYAQQRACVELVGCQYR